MHAIILAGGKGLRLREHTYDQPKALVEIGSHPIIDHIIHHLSQNGVEQITVAGGYLFDALDAHIRQSAYQVKVDCIDTGLHTNTGGRMKRLSSLIKTPALMCWCDALSDIDFRELWELHRKHLREIKGHKVTIAAVHPPPRFGELVMERDRIIGYAEKPHQQEQWISSGYFVVEPEVFAGIEGDDVSWEYDVLPGLVDKNAVGSFRHHGYWQCMDTVHEQELLNDQILNGQFPGPYLK